MPYNAYAAVYQAKQDDLLKPNHLNPDLVRWELHRVWVVEATLREGKRHVYSKRTFYLDEDSWAALASDEYDARGQLYRAGFAYMAPSYDLPAPYTDMFGHYDLVVARLLADRLHRRDRRPAAHQAAGRPRVDGRLAGRAAAFALKPRRVGRTHATSRSARRAQGPASPGESHGPLTAVDAARLRHAPTRALACRTCFAPLAARRAAAAAGHARHLARRARHAGARRARWPRARSSTAWPGPASAWSRSASAATCCCQRRRRQELATGRACRSAPTWWRCSFPTPSTGWAVGHDGVVLHSTDAGRTWTRQLDGRRPGRRAGRALQGAAATPSGSPKPSASRRRAPRTRSSTSGSTMRNNGYRRRRLRPGAAHRRRRQDLGAAAARHRQPEGPAPVRGAPHRRRALHRRRAGPAAEARPRQRPLRRADHPVQGHAVRPGRQRARGARARPARQRRAQHRRRAQLASGPHRRGGRPDRQHARRARPHRHRQPGRACARQQRRRRELHAGEGRAPALPAAARGAAPARGALGARPARAACYDRGPGLETENRPCSNRGCHRLRPTNAFAGRVRPAERLAARARGVQPPPAR